MDELIPRKWYDIAEAEAAAIAAHEATKQYLFGPSQEKEFERNLSPADRKMLEGMRIGV